MSISPHLSPANTPEGCCSDKMTTAQVSGRVVERGRGRTFDDAVDVYSVESILGDEDLDRAQRRVQVCVVVRVRAECTYMRCSLDEGPYGAK